MTPTDAATTRRDSRELANIADNLMSLAMSAETQAEFHVALDVANYLRYAASRLDRLAGPEPDARCVQCGLLPIAGDEFCLCAACKVT